MNFLSAADVAARVAAESINLMLYGPPGTEKTTEAIKAATRDGKCRAFFAQCEPGALKPIAARGLPMPASHEGVIVDWDGLYSALQYVGANRDKFDFLIVDTLTAWVGNIVRTMEAMKLKNVWDGWRAIKAALVVMRDEARRLGVHVIYIAHDVNPAVDDKGIFWPGGPALQPKTAIKEFVGGIDTILRVADMRVGVAMQRVYYTGGTEWPPGMLIPADFGQWYAKNRDGVNWAVVPADLKAYLRMRQPPYANL